MGSEEMSPPPHLFPLGTQVEECLLGGNNSFVFGKLFLQGVDEWLPRSVQGEPILLVHVFVVDLTQSLSFPHEPGPSP